MQLWSQVDSWEPESQLQGGLNFPPHVYEAFAHPHQHHQISEVVSWSKWAAAGFFLQFVLAYVDIVLVYVVSKLLQTCTSDGEDWWNSSSEFRAIFRQIQRDMYDFPN